MKRTILLLFWGYAIVLIQTTWGPALQTGYVRLNGLVPLIVWFGLGTPMPGGLLAALALGVLSEPFSSLPGGLYIIAFSGAYFLVRYIHDHIIYPPLWQQVLLATFISIGVQTVLLVGSKATDLLWPWGFVQAVIDGITYPLWVGLFDSSEKIVTRLHSQFGNRAPL